MTVVEDSKHSSSHRHWILSRKGRYNLCLIQQFLVSPKNCSSALNNKTLAESYLLFTVNWRQIPFDVNSYKKNYPKLKEIYRSSEKLNKLKSFFVKHEADFHYNVSAWSQCSRKNLVVDPLWDHLPQHEVHILLPNSILCKVTLVKFIS